MFLTPGTTYEVVLELSDPDGGRAIRVRELTTRAIPRKPTAGRTLYVVPGSGGGDGSDGNPFQGIDAANAAALPGDRMLLRNGTYTRGTLTTSGAEDNHIVYEPDTGHSPVIDAIAVNADHIWIDNLAFVWNDPTGGATPILDQRLAGHKWYLCSTKYRLTRMMSLLLTTPSMGLPMAFIRFMRSLAGLLWITRLSVIGL